VAAINNDNPENEDDPERKILTLLRAPVSYEWTCQKDPTTRVTNGPRAGGGKQ